jgi:hypothetical protein
VPKLFWKGIAVATVSFCSTNRLYGSAELRSVSQNCRVASLASVTAALYSAMCGKPSR